ncbi:porin family protein [Pelistega ratti]|uniref:porin family protein n=1 Tax=Pelistega ratti TaxID=2652177 RepID=UPI00135B9550|nr:porin family protein [Pelistega ratti]
MGLISSPTYAADTFTGFGLGVDISSSKYSTFESISFKRTTGLGLVADYGFDFGGSNFVGIIEAKVKLNKEKILNDRYHHIEDEYSFVSGHHKVQEKIRFTLSYLQGYRVTDNFLPYVKVGYSSAKLKSEDNFKEVDAQSTTYDSEYASGKGKGLLYGIGFKYAATKNIELGAEYARSNVKFKSDKFKKNTFSINAIYRF